MWGWLALLGGGGILLIVVLERGRRRRAYYDGPYYRQQIQVLAPSKEDALKLPPIKELEGRKQPRWELLRGGR
jgi:hypothetical protein